MADNEKINFSEELGDKYIKDPLLLEIFLKYYDGSDSDKDAIRAAGYTHIEPFTEVIVDMARRLEKIEKLTKGD